MTILRVIVIGSKHTTDDSDSGVSSWQNLSEIMGFINEACIGGPLDSFSGKSVYPAGLELGHKGKALNTKAPKLCSTEAQRLIPSPYY